MKVQIIEQKHMRKILAKLRNVFQVTQETNDGYRNSRVPLEAYPLCKEETSLPELGDAGPQLASFAKLYPTAAAIRDTADAAVLLVSDMKACGIGYEYAMSTGTLVSTKLHDKCSQAKTIIEQ